MEGQGPEIFAIGGPKGAGKSTLARLLLPDELGVHAFVNADLIAQGLSPHAPQRSAIEAGRLMLERIRRLRDARASFAFETTLASRSFAPFLRQARGLGYSVHVLYVSLSNPELALRRVQMRVEKGGHDVPEESVRRRYQRGLRNFLELYRPLASSWSAFDNSGAALLAVAGGTEGGPVRVRDPDRWRALLERATRHGT